MTTSKSDFLAFFWDLASEEQEKRLLSAKNIIRYVENLPTSGSSSPSSSDEATENGDGKASADDAFYTLKRLVRGLSSSREAARQGFASCLCELAKMPRFTVKQIVDMIEDQTKLASATKGSEERDLMFGKLFGYMSLVRSGRLDGDAAVVEDIFSKVLDLMSSKTWVRELVGECLLVILQSFDVSITASLISKLGDLFPETLSLFEPWQLMLGLGLEQLREHSPALASAVNAVLPERHLLTVETFPSYEAALLASTFGFPKIHRVWDFILGQIFGFDMNSRTLPSQR